MDSGGVILTGVPTEYEPLVTLLIAWASAWLVQPMTALAKKWGCTSGVTTVMVSAALSLLVSIGFSLAAAGAMGGVSWPQVILSAVLAFLRANGTYVNDVFTAQKANKSITPVIVRQPPTSEPQPESDGPRVRVLE